MPFTHKKSVPKVQHPKTIYQVSCGGTREAMAGPFGPATACLSKRVNECQVSTQEAFFETRQSDQAEARA